MRGGEEGLRGEGERVHLFLNKETLSKASLGNQMYMNVDDHLPTQVCQNLCIYITPNDAPGTPITQRSHCTHCIHGIHPVRLRPWVLHAPGASPWALMGRALMAPPWALLGQALMGQALMGLIYIYIYIYIVIYVYSYSINYMYILYLCCNNMRMQ